MSIVENAHARKGMEDQEFWFDGELIPHMCTAEVVAIAVTRCRIIDKGTGKMVGELITNSQIEDTPIVKFYIVPESFDEIIISRKGQDMPYDPKLIEYWQRRS